MKNHIHSPCDTYRELIHFLTQQSSRRVRLSAVSCIDSTNEELKRQAKQGEQEIKVLLADSQYKGKGSKGRDFFSPEGSGLYMSLLLTPSYSAADCSLLTVMTASVVARAIEELFGIRAQIKWVNDIYIKGRKIAGILTESSLSRDMKALDWAVVGIGINLAEPCHGFPGELSATAGALGIPTDNKTKCRLAAAIINGFVSEYDRLCEKQFLEDYQQRLFLKGRRLLLRQGERELLATATGIGTEGQLLLVDETGRELSVFSGEIIKIFDT